MPDASTFADLAPITVRLTGEIVPRDRGDAYKGAMFAAHPGDIVFSKIDARNGAIGILPAEIGKAVVTSEFPVFTVDPERLDADFVGTLLRTGGFLEALRRKASGHSGRRRVTAEAFGDLRIPLPTLAEQQAIIAAHRAAQDRAAALEHEAAEGEAEAARAFEAALGLTAPAPLPERPVFVARFRELERWSHNGVLRAISPVAQSYAPYPVNSLGEVGRVAYGLQKSPANRPSSHPRPYLRVANVQRGSLDLAEIKTINVPDEDMPKHHLETGDLLLCEGNSPDLVGRGAIWRNEIPDCVHQNHVLRVRLDQSVALPEFVLAVINSAHGQAYFRSMAKRTTNLASINSKEVAGLPLPLPPLAEQHALVAALEAARSEAATRRAEAKAIRAAAQAAFEAAVYATEPAPANLAAE